MGRYSEYCESGAGWLGELPSHWQLRRISALYDARNEKVSDQDYPPLSVTMQGIVPQLETAAKTQDGDNRKLVRTGDFVINSRSDRRGACGISTYDGSVTLISNVLAPKDRNAMSTRYYSYLFRSEGFADEFYRQGPGIVDDLWSTNWSRMKNILVARPPLAEQESIADYLDAKTAEIDALVADCEREVGLLQEYRKAVISEAVTKGLDPDVPMKDSGVEWIGEIPVTWEPNTISGVTKMITNGYVGPTRDLFVDEGVRYLQSLHIVNGVLDFEKHPYYVADEWSMAHSRSVLNEGDVLVVQTGAIGNCAYVDESYAGCNCHALIVLRPDETQVYGRYLYYYLTSDIGKEKMLLTRTGATHPHLNATKIKFTHVVIPPLDEQRKLIAHLDAKTAEIDVLIDAKRTMAEKLREYRRSLISEAVTGKFKVPGV